jgi:sugar phosphate isomerase/epimerase
MDELGGTERMNVSRRSLFAMAAAGTLLRAQPRPLNFGFSLYGMKTLSWREGLRHVGRIGYPATELCLRAGWDTEPKLLTKADRAEIRKRIRDLGLTLPSVMENLGLARPGGSLAGNLDRLRAAAEICYECSPGAPAIIETTVGGRPDSWAELKNAMADELGAWAQRAEELKVTLAIKAHSKTAMTIPERMLWLADEVKSPRVKLAYDYSHFAAFGLDMRKTMEQVVPRCVFVHIKDTLGTAPNHKFVLPGDGPVDFKTYARNLIELGYRGPVVVEVSVDVFDQPGYDPVKAAEHVWAKVAPAFA